MNCPACGNPKSVVLDSRPSDASSIRRRRECTVCQKRFTTYEIIEAVPLSVKKKNGQLEVFDPNKLKAGIRRACYKRPVSEEQISVLVSDIENELMNRLGDSVKSSEIGNLVMEKLKKIDEVSYVRFASVYREFKDVATFMNELHELSSEKQGK